MEVVVLDGTRARDAASQVISDLLMLELGSSGCDVRSFLLRDLQIGDCRACFGCFVRTPGVCAINDAGRDVARAAVQADLVIYLTPVVFGGYSPELKKAVDRCVCNVSPFFMKVGGEVHHRPRYRRYPSLAGIGLLPQPDDEAGRILKALVERNAINFHSPACAASLVISSRGPDEARTAILELLAEAGVRRGRHNSSPW